MRIRVWQVKNIFSDSLKVADWGGSVFCVMPYEPMILHTLWGVNVETAIKACRALGYIGISAKPRLKMWHGKWYCQEITVKSKKMEALNGKA